MVLRHASRLRPLVGLVEVVWECFFGLVGIPSTVLRGPLPRVRSGPLPFLLLLSFRSELL